MTAELVPEATQVSPGASLRFALVNHGPGRVSYGHPYQVQRHEDGAWVEADVAEPGTGFTMSALAMPAGRNFPQKLGLRDDVLPGRYRIVKHVAIEDSESIILSFEFAVVATESAI